MKFTNYNYKYPTYTHDVCVVGSGAAGLNCADLLYRYGIKDTVLITEGMKMGTSRNTGSDKQTYYKLTVSGGANDSVYDMAQSLFAGGSMHGDLALIEAASSPRGFFRLVELGVPFPFNEFGEYAGYKTDHDERTRATSCGPLTSKYMTEALERAVKSDGIEIYDTYRVLQIFTENSNVTGFAATSRKLVSEDNPAGIALFECRYLVWATGGPSALYESTVYPYTQT
nr:FAD-binding protein [Clostridia bacterium]